MEQKKQAKLVAKQKAKGEKQTKISISTKEHPSANSDDRITSNKDRYDNKRKEKKASKDDETKTKKKSKKKKEKKSK